jgi:DNA-directed RNA polymerase subunit RPC12/RpoP
MPEEQKIPGGVNQAPGLACPQCGFRIQVAINDLLNNRSIRCSSCGLELDVDREKSRAALNALENLSKGIKEVERIKAGTGMSDKKKEGGNY